MQPGGGRCLLPFLLAVAGCLAACGQAEKSAPSTEHVSPGSGGSSATTGDASTATTGQGGAGVDAQDDICELSTLNDQLAQLQVCTTNADCTTIVGIRWFALSGVNCGSLPISNGQQSAFDAAIEAYTDQGCLLETRSPDECEPGDPVCSDGICSF